MRSRTGGGIGLNDEGIWVSCRLEKAVPRPALILDRDGVLVEEVGYLARPKNVTLGRGAVELLQWARAAGLAIAVATNQSGISRGLFGWKDYAAVEAEIDKQLAAHGISLDIVIACAAHPDHTAGYHDRYDYWRKPGPGMLMLAVETLGLYAERSWMIGDKMSDVEAARAAGLAGAVYLRTGHGGKQVAGLRSSSEAFRIVTAHDLIEARTLLATLVD